jgi:hypothetical protein
LLTYGTSGTIVDRHLADSTLSWDRHHSCQWRTSKRVTLIYWLAQSALFAIFRAEAEIKPRKIVKWFCSSTAIERILLEAGQNYILWFGKALKNLDRGKSSMNQATGSQLFNRWRGCATGKCRSTFLWSALLDIGQLIAKPERTLKS